LPGCRLGGTTFADTHCELLAEDAAERLATSSGVAELVLCDAGNPRVLRGMTGV
jgi:hypothetical protein